MSNNGNLKQDVHYRPMYRKVDMWNEAQQMYQEPVVFQVDDSIDGQIIRNGRAVIVVLDDGSKGTAVCTVSDAYDLSKGLKIAYARAMVQHFKKVANKLAYKE